MQDAEITAIEEQAFYMGVTVDKPRPKRQRISAPANGLLDIRQAAVYLRISAKWLYRNYENFPHVRIPAGKKPRIRFRSADLDRWISAHAVDWRTQ
jgi:predicted DNA-binding transcriptional regulator AlpA